MVVTSIAIFAEPGETNEPDDAVGQTFLSVKNRVIEKKRKETSGRRGASTVGTPFLAIKRDRED